MGRRSYGPYSFEASNEGKVLFPEIGWSKGDLIDYYERVAEWILPHLKGRPVVVQRFPDGIDAEGFYQKRPGDYFPEWIETVRVPLKSGDDLSQELVVCRNRATLAYLADQACITLHPWLSRTDRLDHPDLLVVDLDPSGGDFQSVRRGAFRLRDLLEELGLPCFAKLTGSRGVHVVVPLDRSAGFDSVRVFARLVAETLAARHPEEFTTEHRRKKRRGRLYLDVGRNAFGQTAVAPYSIRPLALAPVALPVDWAELEKEDLGPREFTVENVFRRLARRKDPWARVRRRGRSLRRASQRLNRMRADG